jgi:hypothetical protein
MQQVATDQALRNSMIEKGNIQSNKFTTAQYAADIINVYKSVLQ